MTPHSIGVAVVRVVGIFVSIGLAMFSMTKPARPDKQARQLRRS